MRKLYGPFPINQKASRSGSRGPLAQRFDAFRNFDCPNYQKCLDLAAALDWSGFSCQNCSQEVNQQLLWRVRQCCKHDPLAAALGPDSNPGLVSERISITKKVVGS